MRLSVGVPPTEMISVYFYSMDLFDKRQGQMDVDLCYFYTDTIYNFQHLLADDSLKMVIISSLQYFVKKQMINLYGFVIMPNHIHLLWYLKEQNGKETVAGSFTKFTAHEFKKHLVQTGQLHLYRSDKSDRNYQFWKREPLAIAITTENIFLSKLDYIHNNPVKEKWNLCRYPEEYKWSSARFYLEGKDEFGIITHYKD